MLKIVLLVFMCALAGCGAEVAGTAVTGAAIKKQEIQEGKRTEEKILSRMLHAMLVGDAFGCAAFHEPRDPDAAFV